MNLQQLRDYIRIQLDMDEEELPNPLLDSYLSEGFLRTISHEVRWPFYEQRWDVAKLEGERSLLMPPDCDPVGITSLIDMATGARLMQIGSEVADAHFGHTNSEGIAIYYSIEANLIYLHPSQGSLLADYRLRGHRYPTDWVLAGPDAPVDADLRLHQLIAHYAIALCYAQQEDEVLEDVYMKRWQGSLATAHRAICAPRHHRPLVFNAGLPFAPAQTGAVLNLPAS